MMTKAEILDKLRANKSDIQKKYPVASIALFGSFAREEQTSESDIDILIDLNGPMGWDIVDVQESFEAIFPEKKIDMVTWGGLKNSRYRPYIEKDLIYV
jgi:uncharacterized protein